MFNATEFSREYARVRRAASRAHNEVMNKMQKFAKRSKNISYDHQSTCYGMCTIYVTVNKDSKVSAEMLEYVKSICPYTTDERYFTSYEDELEVADTEFGDWEAIAFNIIINRK